MGLIMDQEIKYVTCNELYRGLKKLTYFSYELKNARQEIVLMKRKSLLTAQGATHSCTMSGFSGGVIRSLESTDRPVLSIKLPFQ